MNSADSAVNRPTARSSPRHARRLERGEPVVPYTASIERLESAWENLTLIHLPVHASWLN
jgi:hypothetical protein